MIWVDFVFTCPLTLTLELTADEPPWDCEEPRGLVVVFECEPCAYLWEDFSSYTAPYPPAY